MKRWIAFLLLVAMMVSFAGCKKEPVVETTVATVAETVPETTTEPEVAADVFPDDATIFALPVGGMTPEQAMTAVTELIGAYKMEATVNGLTFTISAADIKLHITLDSVTAYAQELIKGNANAPAPKAEYDSTLLRQCIATGTNTTVADAKISYSTSSKSFTITPERSGMQVDTAAAEEALKPALETLQATGSATVEKNMVEPTVKADDPRLKSGAAAANAYLTISLTYTYTPRNTATKSQTLSKDDIGKMIKFDSNFKPSVDRDAVKAYVQKMHDKYSIRANFKTTSGVTLNLPGGALIHGVDKAAMENDLMNCLQNKISGTRVAPYGQYSENTDSGNFDGNYVEVNLSSQYLWVYKNGVCVVSTPIVSGSVVNNWETPTGVYSIYHKKMHATLVGPGYSTPVTYWMPFSGGYGLHDASWRSEFGGDVYLYSGSHGCVNIPPAAAANVYKNVEVGTKVVLYGGATEAKREPQKLTGTLSYKVTPDAPAFDLNITGLGTPTFTYESDNPNVAEVSVTGKVTIKGVGTAKITVTAPAHEKYDTGKVVVTITVAYDCATNGHKLEWVVTKEATCKPGEKVGTCKCGHKETKVIDPVRDHVYENWTQTKAPTCEPGEEKGTCSCGATTTRAVDPIHDHTYGEWTVTTEPGCESAGINSSTCSGCGHVKTEEIPSTGHDFTTGGETCDKGCGTANPNYTPPSQPSE